MTFLNEYIEMETKYFTKCFPYGSNLKKWEKFVILYSVWPNKTK